MSANGAFGFYKNGVTKVTYNHSDSYPTGLGDKIVKFCIDTNIKDMNDIFDRIILINECEPPTPRKLYAANKLNLVDLTVGDNEIKDFYCLFHGVHGNLQIYQNPEMKWMGDNSSFLECGLFCEWAYIINLDTNILEIYKGGVKKIDDMYESRYYNTNEDYYEEGLNETYYPVKIVAKLTLNNILNHCHPNFLEVTANV